MTDVLTEAPINRRRGWRMLGLIVLGMVLLAIVGGICWYYDDGDLKAIRAKARELGRPVAWSGLGLTPSAAERVQLWERVVALSKSLPAFQEKPGPDGQFFKVWDPIPVMMVAHHAALDATVIAELATTLDQLGDQPLVLHDDISYARRMPEIADNRALYRFMLERVIMAEPHDASIWAKRMLASCRRFNVDSLTGDVVRNSLVNLTLGGIAFRLTDLKQIHPEIADEIRATLQSHYDNLLRSFDGEFVMILNALEQSGKSHGVGFGQQFGFFGPLVVRAGRHGTLDLYLDAVTELRRQKPDALLTWGRAMDAKMNAMRGGLLYPSVILSGLFMPAWSLVVQQDELTCLRGRVIAAELNGTPWPIDLFDPKASQLRPITRDGRVIAAYSVYTDGIDQGGDEKLDRVFPLYAKP